MPPAALIEKTVTLLQGASIPVDSAPVQRGFDHGVFVPLMLAFAEASVPVYQVSVIRSSLSTLTVRGGGRERLEQLSMLSSYDAAVHTKMGKQLGPHACASPTSLPDCVSSNSLHSPSTAIAWHSSA